ncbi:expressed unknown protein [Seminavis robusta]|uniref:Uncharacterized protein n=1 Tax=Seminavis robusta TaxID=568900 RepID=A0A9N8ESM0_9STRA|nr:expressed unknown protein [Seminavis robusta]|eukprot:Sro1985_g309470.1 n/a (90) ;mRNA; f:16556-16825
MMGGQMGPGMMGGNMMGGQMMGGQMGPGMMGGQMGPGMMGGNMPSQMGNLQRLRQMQQMELFGRQMNPVPVGGAGEEPFGRMGSFRPHC